MAYAAVFRTQFKPWKQQDARRQNQVGSRVVFVFYGQDLQFAQTVFVAALRGWAAH